MTAKHLLVGTTILTSLALAALPARANPGLYLDYGESFTVGAGEISEYLEVVVGDQGGDTTLTVVDGGELSAIWGFALGLSSSSGGNRVDVSGVGSRLSALEIYLGHDGYNNTLTVSEGGYVRVADFFIGLNENSNGNTAVISGAGSSLSAGDIAVGRDDADNNTLEVSKGGKITASGDVTVYAGNTLAMDEGGTLEAGSLIFKDGSALRLSVSDTAPASLATSGTATLDGSLTAVVYAHAVGQKSHTLLHADGGLTGAFDSKTLSANDSIKAAFRITEFGVYLDTEASLSGLAGLSGNQSAVATAIDAIVNGSGDGDDFIPLYGLSQGELLPVLSRLTGEAAASGPSLLLATTNTNSLRLIFGQMNGKRGPAGGDQLPDAATRGPAIMPVADVAPAQPGWSVWGGVFGGTAGLSAGGEPSGSHDTDVNTYGIVTGWEHALPDGALLGFTLAGGGGNWSLGQGMGSGDSTFLQLGAYGSQQLGPAYVSAGGLYGFNAMSTRRTAAVGVERERLEAEFNASALAGRVEAGYRLGAEPGLGLTPYAAFTGQAFFQPGFEEDDSRGAGSFPLEYDSNTATALRSELGLGLDGAIGAAASLYARAAWAHDWTSDRSVTAAFQPLPGARFTVHGAEAPENIALVSAGAEMALSEAAGLSADFNGEFAEDYQSYAGSLKLALSW